MSSVKDGLNCLKWCGKTHTQSGQHLLVAAQKKTRNSTRKIIHFLLLGCYTQDKLIYPAAVVAYGNGDDDGGGNGDNSDADSIDDIRTRNSKF